MEFISTRGKSKAKNASEAIVKGIAEDGGLFVPSQFPQIYGEIPRLLDMDYAERAAFILSKFLDEYDFDGLSDACKAAYAKFDGDAAPLVKIDEGLFILELFHGPTLAFKDVALTLLPYLLRAGCDNAGIDSEVMILVATSGDTGKAALEGFKDNAGVKIMVFYPDEGVSAMQKLQMCTTEGENVAVVAVKGNFDDCQTAVKRIFGDKEFGKKLLENNVIFSSANSMNFGRLCPQIVYYFSAYCDLVNAGEIQMGDRVDFTVPTGNFGNILAGYYAMQMGLPVGKLVCASNKNNVLTDFFDTGKYDVNREFYKTMSPSMDILVSSNLERLIFEIEGRNAQSTLEKMSALSKSGSYSIDKKQQAELSKVFYAGFADEKTSAETMSNFFEEYDYALDPHTAVAMTVADAYACNNAKNERPTVVLSTASPYKFPSDVLRCIAKKTVDDPFIACKKLENLTAVPVPEQITVLKTREARFKTIAEKTELEKYVSEFAAKRV